MTQGIWKKKKLIYELPLSCIRVILMHMLRICNHYYTFRGRIIIHREVEGKCFTPWKQRERERENKQTKSLPLNVVTEICLQSIGVWSLLEISVSGTVWGSARGKEAAYQQKYQLLHTASWCLMVLLWQRDPEDERLVSSVSVKPAFLPSWACFNISYEYNLKGLMQTLGLLVCYSVHMTC